MYQVKVYNHFYQFGEPQTFTSYKKARSFISQEIRDERRNYFTVIVDKWTIETHLGSHQGYHEGSSFHISKVLV